MAHWTTRTGYVALVDRLNRFPQGAPPSDLLLRILRLLFSEREAFLVAQLPLRPFTAVRASRAWGLSLPETRQVLEELASRALLLDVERDGEMQYVLPPPMAGFFEFSMMRVRPDLDQKLLAELFYQYLNVEEEFLRSLFAGGQTQLGRVLVHEPALPADGALEVLDWERASEVIRGARHRAISRCYCRHKMDHLGRACEAPQEICMSFGNVAASLARHGHAREVTTDEGLELLAQARQGGLVQFGENVRQGMSFICNCCGCCCEAMIAARRFAAARPIHTTGYLPRVQPEACTGCGRCVDACPVAAASLVSAEDPHHRTQRRACIDEDLCLGCGVCVRACPRQGLRLEPRPQRTIPPANTAHRVVLMAVERGTLQHLVFDNQVLWSHRAAAALLGAVLRLPPLKQRLAAQQLRSRFVESLLTRQRIW
jgi:ferredoxin